MIFGMGWVVPLDIMYILNVEQMPVVWAYNR